jgi:molybdopterin synthase sulfur carrier subunit
MKALYFAWVREKIGKSAEDIAPPPEVATVAQLIAWLSQQGDGYQDAFASGTVRVALDRTHVKHEAMLGTPAEIAFFPPMTGG